MVNCLFQTQPVVLFWGPSTRQSSQLFGELDSGLQPAWDHRCHEGERTG